MKTFGSMLMLVFALPALAGKTEAVLTAPVSTIQSLDEVLIEGDQTLSAARIAVVVAEDRFYARWNEVNRDPRFRMHCNRETPRDHPSLMTERVCRPAFLDRIDEEAARQTMAGLQGAMGGDGTVVVLPTPEPQILALRAEMRKRTLEMIRKDPQLKRALLEHARLVQHFEELHKAKFKDHWIVWD